MDNKNETPVSTAPAPAKKDGLDAKKAAASIFDIFEMFAICTAVILLLFSYVARLTVVEGPSMEDTLYENDYLIVYDMGYTPERGDIVVIHNITAPLGRANAEPIIKRVIAVEGDTVKIDNDTDTVYVNGKVIDEPYANFEDKQLYNKGVQEWEIEEGKIFVLGDHRNHSTDSRSYLLGQIDARCVVGRAVLRVLPFEKFGVMERAKYE